MKKTCRKIISVLVVIVAVINLAGCGYRGGKVKGGVYTNDYFGIKLTPPEWIDYVENPEEADDWVIALSYCYMQGQKDSFMAEYALQVPSAGLIICSEDNPGGVTADDFVKNIQAQQKEKVFFSYTTIVDKDVYINDVSFRQLTFDSNGNHQTFLIKVYDDRILFIYISTTANAVEDGEEDELIASVTGI